MTTQRKPSKLLATLVTLTMVLSLVLSQGTSASAYDLNSVYLIPAAGTQFTTMASAGSTVNLDVIFSAYNAGTSTWYNAGFDTAAEAASANWSIANDPSGIIATGPLVTAQTVGSLIASRGTVILNTGASGVAIVNVKVAPTFTINLAIAVDALTPSSGSVATNVYVVDSSTSPGTRMIDNLTTDVYAPAYDSMGGLLIGKSEVFQNLPTAAGTLDALLYNGELSSASTSPTGGYISSIDGIAGSGWSYAVYDASGNLNNLSQQISASLFELQNANNTVVWKTNGSWYFQSTLAAEMLTW
jgi:hypothetical protein